MMLLLSFVTTLQDGTKDRSIPLLLSFVVYFFYFNKHWDPIDSLGAPFQSTLRVSTLLSWDSDWHTRRRQATSPSSPHSGTGRPIVSLNPFAIGHGPMLVSGTCCT